MGLENLGGGYHLFFCVFFFGMVFVSFIFFLLSDLGFNSGFFCYARVFASLKVLYVGLL